MPFIRTLYLSSLTKTRLMGFCDWPGRRAPRLASEQGKPVK
jgi:hypothetical protein